jgi:hypothetical protein
MAAMGQLLPAAIARGIGRNAPIAAIHRAAIEPTRWS